MSKIIVKSTVDGFRRGGHAFNREGVVLDTAKLGKAQLAAIEAEPKLVVAEYQDAKAKADKAAADKAAGGKGDK